MHVIESTTLEFQSFTDQQEYWRGMRGGGGGGGEGEKGTPPHEIKTKKNKNNTPTPSPGYAHAILFQNTDSQLNLTAKHNNLRQQQSVFHFDKATSFSQFL